jgi:hypothetical protein
MSWDTTTWHADRKILVEYAAGRLSRARTASVEAHLLTCASCRSAVAPLVEMERLDCNLAAITDRVDQPRPHLLERLLLGVGVPDRICRVLTVTPSARVAWIVAVMAALAVAGIADASGSSERAEFVFLVAAPLLPLIGTAAVFSTRGDPARELVLAAPMPGFDLLLMRSLAVLAPTLVVAVVAGALVPEQGWELVLWLLPALGLVAATLALGTWFPVRAAALVVGGVWVVAAAISARDAPGTDLVESFAAFRPGGQVVLIVVALVAGVVVVLRRDAFDSVDPGRLS